MKHADKRMTKLTALIMAAMVLVLLASSCAMGEGSHGIAYRVTGGKNDMTVLGSIHVGNEDMYPLSDALQEAIAAADTLIFECDSESAEVMSTMLELMYYPKGETLQDHVSKETYALLKEALKATGYSVSVFNAFRPWAVSSTFALMTTALEMGVDDITKASELGVESQIIQMTKDDGKAVGYLETAELQLEMMNDFSPDLQEYMLQTTCEELLSDPEEVAENSEIKYWPSWWRDGDVDSFVQSYLVSMQEDPMPELMEEYHYALVTERNANMAEGIRALLESDEPHSYFVTVGLLHLVLPEDSVMYELQKMGYTVEKLN